PSAGGKSRRARRPARRSAAGHPRADRGREARGARRASGDRCRQPLPALGGGARSRRRSRHAHRARLPEPGLRGEVRLPLRRLRQRPFEEGDPRGPAPAARVHARGGARHCTRGARGDRGGPVASLLAFDSYATDWLNLLVRWLHVIAGIVWIGSSFYFIALDNHLRPPRDERDVNEGIGEAWEIHGGGFYNIKKYLVAPRVLPETLHWFKWEAYTTWLSGFALMVVLYYLNADTYLIDKSVADLSTGEAVAISIGLLAAAWLVYDLLCRMLASRPLVLATVLLALITF